MRWDVIKMLETRDTRKTWLECWIWGRDVWVGQTLIYDSRYPAGKQWDEKTERSEEGRGWRIGVLPFVVVVCTCEAAGRGWQSELGARPTGRPEEVACNMGSAARGGVGHPALPATAGLAKLMERVDQGGEPGHGLGIGPGHRAWALDTARHGTPERAALRLRCTAASPGWTGCSLLPPAWGLALRPEHGVASGLDLTAPRRWRRSNPSCTGVRE